MANCKHTRTRKQDSESIIGTMQQNREKVITELTICRSCDRTVGEREKSREPYTED